MIGCASSPTPLTLAAVSHPNSPAPVRFPRRTPPTLGRLATRRRVYAGVRAAYSSAAVGRESEYTARDSAGGRYSSSYRQPPSTFASPNAAPSLYDVLGLSAGATAAEIKTAYRRLARSCHPDASNGSGASASAEQFMRVHAAYATLSDPEKRVEYDRRLVASVSNGGVRRAGHVYQSTVSYSAPAAGAMGTSTFGRRTWETDQCW